MQTSWPPGAFCRSSSARSAALARPAAPAAAKGHCTANAAARSRQRPRCQAGQQPAPPPPEQQQGRGRASQEALPSPLLALDVFNLGRLVGSPAYTAICLMELVVVLGVVDAAYSGDWSRIGAISTDAELALQKVVWVIAAGHTVTAGLAAKVAMQRGQPWAVPAAKGLLFGALAVFEQEMLAARDRQV